MEKPDLSPVQIKRMRDEADYDRFMEARRFAAFRNQAAEDLGHIAASVVTLDVLSPARSSSPEYSTNNDTYETRQLGGAALRETNADELAEMADRQAFQDMIRATGGAAIGAAMRHETSQDRYALAA